jgi:prepilin-type N-terminal cleavage/methylation domain-containing protein
MIHPTRPTPRPARRAFTLIELLVVMAIIAVLIGLSTAAVMAVLTAQTKSATKTSLDKVANYLKKQWQATLDQAGEDFRAYPNTADAANIQAAYTQAGGNPDAAKKLYLQFRLQLDFPTNLAEAAASPKYAKAVAGLNSSNQPQPQLWESSVCLYLALSKARRGEGDTLSLEDGLGAGSIQTVNGAKVIVDNYGTPIAYTRGLGLDPTNPTKFVPQVRSAGPNKIDQNGSGDDIVSQPQFQ